MKRSTYTLENAIFRPGNKYFMRSDISNKSYLLASKNQLVTATGSIFPSHILPEGGNLLQ